MKLFAIDPGPQLSAWMVLQDGAILGWGHDENDKVRRLIDAYAADGFAVENVVSYGMAVGQDTLETCVEVGRFIERWEATGRGAALRPSRKDVLLHNCHSRKAKPPELRQALIDRYGPGKEKAIGLKKTPGPLYGLKDHGWAVLGVAVTAADQLAEDRQLALVP
jgi:hypothetical protein